MISKYVVITKVYIALLAPMGSYIICLQPFDCNRIWWRLF